MLKGNKHMKLHKIFFIFLFTFVFNQNIEAADDGSDFKGQVALPTDVNPKIIGYLLNDTKV